MANLISPDVASAWTTPFTNGNGFLTQNSGLNSTWGREIMPSPDIRTPPKFSAPPEFNPISTELQTGNPYYTIPPSEPKPVDEKPQEERIGGEGGGLNPVDNSIFGDRGFHYAWEDWGPLSKGLGMSTTGFKGALNNAKIGLTGLNIFGHPMDDPGWASVMAANGFTKADLEQYYSMPGQPMPATFGDAFKQHTSLSTKALEAAHTAMNSPTSGLSQFSSVNKDAINVRSGTFNGYSFDRAGYMAALAANPATAQYAAHVTSNNNVNATKTMLGAMALGSSQFKGTAISSSIAFNLEPHLAYDYISAMMGAGMSMDQISNSFDAKSRIDSMTPTQRMQYMSALMSSPEFAAYEASKSTKAALAIENARLGFGAGHGLDSKDADIAGRAASTAAKESLGISPDKSFGQAMKDNPNLSVDDVTEALSDAYGHSGGGGDGGNDNWGGDYGDFGGTSGLDADNDSTNNESGMVGEESW
ncbi:MAG: hypothetical protein WC175_03800 [Candidatus Dojkabacteria bacterium]